MLDRKITYGDSVLTFGGGTRLLYLNNEFVLELTITGSSQTITLPTQQRTPEWVYNCTINWGDGNTTTMTDRTSVGRIHVYASPGVYELSISGTYECFKIYGGTDLSQGDNRPIMRCITKILNWGYVGMKEIDFWGCENLISVNPNNGSYLTSLTSLNMDYLFYKCINLISIPADLFSDLSIQTSFYATFFGCKKLASIPAGLFDNCTEATNFGLCFQDCFALTSIPTDLFKNNTKVTTFEFTFSGCKGLTSIPTDIFRYNTEVTSFRSTFGKNSEYPYNGLTITSIPSTIFIYNTGVTDFSNTFYYCNSLTSIPTDLFRYNTLVTNFASTFGRCNNITSIPTDLFRYNTLVTNFSQTFNAEEPGGKITSIPATLFTYNTLVTNFQWTFQRQLQLTGNAPTLWTIFTAPEVLHDGCFYGDTSLTNYASIPSDWK